jgi:chromosome partitioning protein
LRLTVCNLKGGTGKTMSSVYLAAGLSRRGRTLAVDADPQGSLLSWSEEAAAAGTEFGFPIVALPVKDLHRRTRHFIGDYEHLVVDTPPGYQAIVRSAVLAAEAVVIPVQPSLMDLDRLRPTVELLAELAEINDVSVYAVMTRVRRGTRSARETRTVLEEDMGLEVLSTEVPLREAFGMSFGLEPGPLMEYEEVLEEIAATEEVA